MAVCDEERWLELRLCLGKLLKLRDEMLGDNVESEIGGLHQ